MGRVIWGVLLSFIIIGSVGVVIVWLNGENNTRVLQEQSESIAENQVQMELMHDLLSKMQQEMQQLKIDETERHSGSQKPITFDLLDKMQQEIHKQGKEITNDREKVMEWQELVQTFVRFSKNETANDLMEVLQDIATNRSSQGQRIELLQQDMQKHQEAIADIRVEQKQNSKSLEHISQTLSECKIELSTQREESMNNRNETLKNMEQLEREHKQIRSAIGSYRSCNSVNRKPSGKYIIRGKDILYTFAAYCEQEKFDGGWMVIQHRSNGALDFNRSWTDYRNGFGEVDGEHWLGLENIHQFTKKYKCELLIEMTDFYNNSKYAIYDSFSIGSEAEQYRLTTLGTYTGTAGDSLTPHKGMKFSTADRDNDVYTGNCAEDYGGGWWFFDCYHAFLNGFYRNASGKSGQRIAWDGFNSDQRGMSYSRMLIRP